MVNGNGKYAPTSLDAWNQHTTETIPLTDDLSVEIQSVDFLALLTAEQGTNPLLALIQDIVNRDEKNLPQIDAENVDMNKLLADPAKLKAMVDGLDSLLKKIVISPPLLEQGHTDGIPLARFKTEWKMKIFEHISGGTMQLETAQRFHQTEAASLVIAQSSEDLRNEAK